MDRLVTLLEQLRINTIAQLGEEVRWEVAGYEAWADDLMGLLLKAQRPKKRLAV